KKQVQKLEKNGYAPGKTVISYCHVGLGRGSFQYLALRRAGVQNVKVYVGSWDEWGNDASLPLASQP
ncbi:MAG TPA: rhodanese-like domain-containing protein, partial [Anaeromyxobacteraceae bacterium]|nr:rhodanese-like domain-containing protein [Anaeromyxobacteraceae bacterium]